MSDIEEVVLTRGAPKASAAKKDTKPEIARLKMKEKRERLKKEKEDAMINEAKRRLAEELESKKIQEQKKKQEEEEKLKADPIYQIRMMLEKLTAPAAAPATAPPKTKGKSKKVEEPVYVEPESDIGDEPEVEIELPVIPKKRVYKKKVVVAEPEPEPEPKAKAKAKAKAPPKPRKKKLPVEDSPTTQIYGSAPRPAPQEIYYEPTNPLLEKMAQRRRMGSYY